MKEKLQEYAFIAEILTAIAVVLSLVFVGLEIRQSTQTQIQTATQAAIREFAAASRAYSENSEIACIYLRGNQDYESLNDLEKFRYSSYSLHNYRAIQEMYNLFQEGAIDIDSWSSIDSLAREPLHRPGVQQWLSTRRHWFSEEFQSYMDEIINSAPPLEAVFYDPEGCSDSEV